jgi:hypothetical protein
LKKTVRQTIAGKALGVSGIGSWHLKDVSHGARQSIVSDERAGVFMMHQFNEAHTTRHCDNNLGIVQPTGTDGRILCFFKNVYSFFLNPCDRFTVKDNHLHLKEERFTAFC